MSYCPSYQPNMSALTPAIALLAIRAQGAGGQNVNKVSSAVHLRFDITQAPIPEFVKNRLLSGKDKRITKEGILILKCQRHRTQELNKQDALERLEQILVEAGRVCEARRPTKPSKRSQTRRVDRKVKLGKTKILRQKVEF